MNKYNINYEEVRSLYSEKGLTFKEIGIIYNCSAGPIRKIAKRHGLKSIRGKSKQRKIIVQKSSLPLSIAETDIFSHMSKFFNEKELEVLIGSLLGDSYLKVRQNKNEKAYNVYFSNCEKQLNYLKFKRSFFRNDVCNDIRQETEAHKQEIKGKECNIQSLFTFSTKPSDLSYIFSILNNGKRKIITRKYLEYLTPLSLAIWYQDDGSYNPHNRVVRIATMCFSQEENNVIKNYFYDNLKMPCLLEKTEYGLGWSLVLTQNSTKKFLNLISPYICDCMMYKNPVIKTNPSETLKVNNNTFMSKDIQIN